MTEVMEENVVYELLIKCQIMNKKTGPTKVRPEEKLSNPKSINSILFPERDPIFQVISKDWTASVLS